MSLEEEVIYHMDKYYNFTPEISDKEFDKLVELLKIQNPDSKLLKEVGETSWEGFEKAEHLMVMGSQDKLNSFDEIDDWIRVKNIKFPVIVEHKLDGLSVELQYKKGALKKCLTRGNSVTGDNITSNVIKMGDVVYLLNDETFTGAIRGEIVLTRTYFNNFFPDAKNPRNMASGIAKRKDGEDSEKLNVVVYDVFGKEFKTESEKIEFLHNENFNTVEGVKCNNRGELISIIQFIEENKDTFEVSIDGIVIKQNLIVESDLSRKRPEYQRAYKFEDETATTKVLGIEFSRNGMNYSPVAELEPVELNETIVKRASLANLDNISKLGLKLGDTVLIRKANEIIPQIISVIESNNGPELVVPTNCKVCNSKLEITGTRIYCPNLDCLGRKNHRIAKWIEKTGVKGFGPALIDYLFLNEFVEDIIDLYTVDVDSVLEATNLKKATKKAFENLYKVKELSLEKFISGFDIEGIGEGVIKFAIKAGYKTLDDIVNATIKDFEKIEGFSSVRAEILHNALKDLKQSLYELQEIVKIIEVNNTSTLENKNFCFTGSLKNMTRNEAKDLVLKNGGNFKSGVSNTLDYLINNDKDSNSSKNKKAKELSIPILNEEEFMKLLT